MLNDDDDTLIRSHIRELLSEYVYTHIAIDHEQYTQMVVSDLLAESLRPVPMHDPRLLAMPIDPMDALARKLGFSSLEPYDERWESEPDVVQFIKRVMMAPGRELKTQRVWEESPDVNYTNMPHHPRTSLLSRNSKKKTPSLGTKRLLHNSFRNMVPSRALRKVAEEQISEQKTVKLEDMMGLKLVIEADVHAGMVEYHRNNLFLTHVGKPRALPMQAGTFLRSDSPPFNRKLVMMSPPLFPRDRRTKEEESRNTSLKEHLAAPSAIKPVKVESIEPDLADENMAIVNGWTAIISSERDTPSLSSGTSEADELEGDNLELWRPSSSVGLPDAIEALREAKMDQPLFPREERLRGGKYKMNIESGDEKPLSAFLSAHIPMHSSYGPKILSTPKSDDDAARRPSSPTASMVAISMLGQPPSDDGSRTSAKEAESGCDAFDVDISRVLKTRAPDLFEGIVKHQDVIMHERLDEKEAMFMNVPNLPAPNVYLHDTSTNELPSLCKHSIRQSKLAITTEGPPVALQKVTGLKSLNLELSWRPFNYGSKIPTHQELVGIDLASLAEGYKEIHEAINPFFLEGVTTQGDNVDFGSAISSYSERTFLTESEEDKAHVLESSKTNNEQLILLSRSERQAMTQQNILASLVALPPDLRDNPFENSSATTLDYSSRLLTPEPGEDSGLVLTNDSGLGEEDILEFEPDSIDESEWKRSRLLPHNTTTREDEVHDIPIEPQQLTVNPKDLYLTSSVQPAFVPQASSVRNMHNEPIPAIDHTRAALDGLQQLGAMPVENGTTSQTALTIDDSMILPNKPLQRIAAGIGKEMAVCLEQQPLTSATISDKKVPTPTRLPKASLLCERQSLASFLSLRGKKGTSDPVVTVTQESEELPVPAAPVRLVEEELTYHFDKDARLSLFRDTRAFTIPETWPQPSQQHAYLASLDLIQQRGLVRALESPQYCAQLVERDTITSPPVPKSSETPKQIVSASAPSSQLAADVALIVAPDAAVVFFPLAALPSQTPRTMLFDALARHSWRFARILVVFLAFPRLQLFRVPKDFGSSKGKAKERSEGEMENDGPCAYSPPVLKVCRRLRRDLALHAGTGEQHAACIIELAFADSVADAARFVRVFGDAALGGSVVDMVPYLGEEEQEGEYDLAQLEGMNTYCAAVILRCCTLKEFLIMSPDQRTQGFADLIGLERIEHVNKLLQNRMQTMDMDSDFTDFA